MHRYFSPLRFSRWLVCGAAALVPAQLRSDWKREWHAELQGAATEFHLRCSSPWELLRFARGCVEDAVWLRLRGLDRAKFARGWQQHTSSPGFCLAILACLLGFLALASGLLPAARDVFFSLPYKDAGQIATLSEGGVRLATRSGILPGRVRLLRTQSRLLEDAATYSWRQEPVSRFGRGGSATVARVSSNFFSVLGVEMSDGLALDARSLRDCWNCILLSHEYWKHHYGGNPIGQASDISVAGQRYVVAGVMPKDFWFLSREVSMWMLTSADQNRKGVVARLRPGASEAEVARELESILLTAGVVPWDALVEVSPLQSRVRSVLNSFTLAMLLAWTMIATTLHLRAPDWNWRALVKGLPAAGFFLTKTLLGLLAVLLAGLEFTHAASITMLGGTDLLTEPLSTWLFLMGCLGVLTWSIQDQRRRCRVCLRRLGLAAHVGCSGSMLLDWAGTELVCMEGHGMLHVPEMAASWSEPERWTSLDDSWVELFARR